MASYEQSWDKILDTSSFGVSADQILPHKHCIYFISPAILCPDTTVFNGLSLQGTTQSNTIGSSATYSCTKSGFVFTYTVTEVVSTCQQQAAQPKASWTTPTHTSCE